MGDGNHPNPPQSLVRKENKAGRCHPGALLELLTQVSASQTRDACSPFPGSSNLAQGLPDLWQGDKGPLTEQERNLLQGRETHINTEIPTSPCAGCFPTPAHSTTPVGPRAGNSETGPALSDNRD